ncbi:MAG TPA: hypothetical protein VGP82_08395 [Ktedonobacterales bacterium]|nr:hypothetical protein [Ktedonobacterales bacterium]
MARLRRYVYRLLMLVAAIALIFAGMQAASAAPDALRDLTFLNFGHFMDDIRGTVVPIAVALFSGMSALVTAPHFATGGAEFVPDEQWRRIWAHDM